MDEFLVSGETIVRNLEAGHAAGRGARRRDGRRVPAGHVRPRRPDAPDPAPGRASATPSSGAASRPAIDRHAFRWLAPDGSTVRTEYLLGGYGNARDLFAISDPAIVRRRVAALRPQPRADLRRPADPRDVRRGPLAARGRLRRPRRRGERVGRPGPRRRRARSPTTSGRPPRTRPTPRRSRPGSGELRSGARANVLMGVTSHRADVKQAAGRAERLLERLAEPLAALHGATWPARLLELAWRRVIENSAHDSICACSRRRRGRPGPRALRRGRADRRRDRGRASGRDVGRRVPRGAHVVLNPTPIEREAVVELDARVPLAGRRAGDAGGDGRGGRRAVGRPARGRAARRVAAAGPGGRPPGHGSSPSSTSRVATWARSSPVRAHARELYTFQMNGFRVERPERRGRPDRCRPGRRTAARTWRRSRR